MFNPNQVTRTHLFGDSRQQCPTFAEVASYGVLRERMTTLVPAIYDHDKAFFFSRLIALFHTIQRSPLAKFMNCHSIARDCLNQRKAHVSPEENGPTSSPRSCVLMLLMERSYGANSPKEDRRHASHLESI
jgi:hypothetical protein